LMTRAKRSATDLLTAASKVSPGATGNPMVDPSLAAAVAGRRRAVSDLERLRLAGDWLGGPDEAAGQRSPREQKVAQRLLRLAPSIGRAGAPDPTGKFVPPSPEDLETPRGSPAEAELRGGTGRDAWTRITGGRAAEVIALIDVTRGAW